MKANRREFLRNVGLSGAALAAMPILAAENRPSTFLTKQPAMKIGMVTYQLGQDWDIPTIIKNCEAAHFQGVELRTSHKHGVEVTLSKEEREAVRKRFENSK